MDHWLVNGSLLNTAPNFSQCPSLNNYTVKVDLLVATIVVIYTEYIYSLYVFIFANYSKVLLFLMENFWSRDFSLTSNHTVNSNIFSECSVSSDMRSVGLDKVFMVYLSSMLLIS